MADLSKTVQAVIWIAVRDKILRTVALSKIYLVRICCFDARYKKQKTGPFDLGMMDFNQAPVRLTLKGARAECFSNFTV